MKASPKIDFYLTEQESPQSRFLLACRLAEKAYQHHHPMYIHTPSQTEGKILDDLLWTYRDASFIPHAIYQANLNPLPPIQIGYQIQPSGPYDILLNLTDPIPDFFIHFQRVIEIVTPAWRQIGREHYRRYREAGLTIETHKISQ